MAYFQEGKHKEERLSGLTISGYVAEKLAVWRKKMFSTYDLSFRKFSSKCCSIKAKTVKEPGGSPMC